MERIIRMIVEKDLFSEHLGLILSSFRMTERKTVKIKSIEVICNDDVNKKRLVFYFMMQLDLLRFIGSLLCGLNVFF